MQENLNEMLGQYKDSLKGVRHLIYELEKLKEGNDQVKADLTMLRGMERDLEWAIEYMETGYMPISYGGKQYKRVVPVDPLEVLGLFSRALISSRPSRNHLNDDQRKLLSWLTEREKEALVLVIIEGISYGEAAKLMNVTKGSVVTYVIRGKKKLKEKLLERGYVDNNLE